MMTPRTRRLAYALSYEVLGIALSSAGLMLFGPGGAGESLAAATATTFIALGWSLAFNTAFETREQHQPQRGRPPAPAAHPARRPLRDGAWRADGALPRLVVRHPAVAGTAP
jgi:uncharacterized membrane protein